MNPNWSEYEKLVMFRLDEMREDILRLEASQAATTNAVNKLQVKASMWGALGGIVTGLTAFLFHPKGN